ncbi:MAG: hypothetical protein A2Y24_06125 [Clostridiales bacterium GWE2_32_10]|nr:MAG: hypothetical protein A2Y24_06125 [Clostridiales bacterium GWE2_32_10]HBY21539.1 hypothetical protein [Clostridiales bacterium]
MKLYKSINQYILEKSAGFRCGITLPFQEVENTFSDIEGIFNISVPNDAVEPWQSASGSINRDKNYAIMGAIAESLERYSSAVTDFPVKKLSEIGDEKVILHGEFSLFSEEQYNNPNFIWKKVDLNDAFFGEVYSLYDNEKVWVPQELIGLGTKVNPALLPSTSTGVAAHFDEYQALLLATEEMLERDALATYWLNSLGGREIQLAAKYLEPVLSRNGKVYCFDVTQDWNPYPVIMICGYLKQRNKKRISMGVACRETYEKAIEKAYVEWMQGCIFAGFYDVYHPNLKLKNPDDLKSFDEHAVYYTLYPELWEKVPLIKKRITYDHSVKKDNIKITDYNPKNVLEDLLEKLEKEKIRIFYRDITSKDVKETGLKVVRVLSPELSLIHGDESTPFLGGKTSDVSWRYAHIPVKDIDFPNKFPHPLG